MITEYVLSSNIIDHVGTQDKESTIKVLNSKKDKIFLSKIELETVQMKEALEFIIELHNEIKKESIKSHEILFLTESNILESQRILMKNIGCDIGYRTFPVGTYTSNGFYEYEEYQNIQTKTQNLIDNINSTIVKLSANDSMPTIEDMISICTKWLFEFLQIHPFVDGNGRIARLWMTYLLLPYFPFIINISSGLRDNYISSLERKSFKELEDIIIESITNHIKNA